MKIERVMGIFPVFIFYTNKFINKPHAGMTRGPYVFIKPEYKNDKGLLAHEIVHAKYFYKYPIIRVFLSLSKDFKLKEELDAYSEQLFFCENKVYGLKIFATFISERYGLNISKLEAEVFLREAFIKKGGKI